MGLWGYWVAETGGGRGREGRLRAFWEGDPGRGTGGPQGTRRGDGEVRGVGAEGSGGRDGRRGRRVAEAVAGGGARGRYGGAGWGWGGRPPGAVNPGIESAHTHTPAPPTWCVIGAGAGGGTIKRVAGGGVRSGPSQAVAMPGRAEPSGERAAVEPVAPVAVPVSVAPEVVARPGGAGLRAKGFAITDLLGLEAELQPPLGPATAAATGSYEGGGALGLGLGLLCGLGGPRAPCLLPAPLPLLPARGPRLPTGPLPAARRHKENISGERNRGRGVGGRSPAQGDPWPELLPGLPRTCGPGQTWRRRSILPPPAWDLSHALHLSDPPARVGADPLPRFGGSGTVLQPRLRPCCCRLLWEGTPAPGPLPAGSWSRVLGLGLVPLLPTGT